MAFNLALAYLLFTSLLVVGNIAPVIAQSIVPATDGTNTIVTPEGNRIDISGGMRSRDGENLFHSLTKFGLTPQEIANFLSLPEIRNILVRVNGGEASFINGLIQVTGGNSNLFLMNPSGIVFGSNASLNVPAAFIATTANGIGFGNNWFNADGVNNYTELIGTPASFAFTMNQPGSIINSGNLAVGIGQDLGLIGGTVINTGNLSAPAGNIRLMAVEGQSLVRLSQPGFVLSLDMQPPQTIPNNWTLPILSIPQLLTGGSGGNATGVAVNPDGSIQLTGSGIRIPTAAGVAIASGTIDTSTPPLSKGGQGGIGTVDILGNKVGVVSAKINASGTNDGGKVRIGGDYKGQGTVPNASVTYVSSDTVISVDSFIAGNGGRAIVWADDTTRFYGTITARGGKIEGNGGFVETSGKNGLDVTGASVDASATKGLAGNWLLDPHNVTIQFVTPFGTSFTGGDPNIFSAIADNAVVFTGTIENTLAKGTSVTINTGTTGTQEGNITVASPINPNLTGGDATLTLDAANDILVKATINNASTTNKLNVVLSAGGNVNVNADIITVGGNININSGGAINTSAANLNSSSTTGDGGAIALTAAKDITTNNIAFGAAGNGIDNPLKIDTAGIVNINGDINNNGADIFIGGSTPVNQVNLNFSGDTLSTFGGNLTIKSSGALTIGKNIDTDGGAINLTGKSINTTTVNLESSNSNGDGGAIAFDATNNITTGNIDSRSLIGNGKGGQISLTSSGGTIDTSVGTVISGDTLGANGGAIAFSAPTNITAGNINANGASQGGDISLTSDQINFTAGDNSVISNKGNLLIQPFTPSQNLSLAPITIAPFKDGFDSIAIGRTDGTGNITIAAPIAFSDPTIIRSPGGEIAINAPITGKDNASITLTATTTTLKGNITTAEQNITINGNTTIGNSVTVSTGTQSGGNITFNGTIDGNNNLNLATGTGDIFIAGAVGENTRLGNLTIDSATTVVTQAITAASITQKAGSGTTSLGALNANKAAGINLTGNGFNLNGNITTTNNGGFRIDNASPLTLVADKFNLDGSFNQLGAGAVSISGNLTTTNDNISFKAPVTLIGNTEFNAGTALISINSSLTGGSNNLTLTADGIELGGSISGKGDLVLQPFTPSQAIALGIPTNTGTQSLDLSQGELNNLQDGFNSITIGRTDSSGTISIDGSISFQDPVTIRSPVGAGTIAFNGGSITGKDNAAIALIANQNIKTGDITAPAGITITSNSGAIDGSAGTLNSSNPTGKAGAIALSSPNSIAVAGIDATGNPGGDIRLTSNGINFTGIANSIRSNGILTLQPFTPNDNLTLTANNLATLQDGFSAIAIGSNNGKGTITLPNPITFNDPVIIQSPNGAIVVGGGIRGLDNASITLNGNTTLNADVTTANQNININGNTTLGNNVTLATGGGNLVINGTIDGNNNLTLEAGNGNITLNNPIGNNTRLGNFRINSANNVLTQSITAASIAQITGSGTTNFASLNTNSPAGIDVTGNSFNFNGNITASNNGGLRINNNGAANIPATTNINLDGAFNQTGAGSVGIAGNITTTNDDIRFNGPVTLAGNANFNPGIAAIAFNSTLNTGNNPLTLTASEIDFGGAVSGTNSLTLQPATPEQNITIGGFTPGNLNLTNAEIANLQNGFSAVTIGRADSTGSIAVNSVTFADPVTIQTGVGAIAIAQPITGIDNASLTLDAATTTLNANITTAGQNITIGRNTILGADVILSTGFAGDIIFNGSVNGSRQLSLNAGTGSIRFNAGVGLLAPLSSLNITSAQNIFLARGIATTSNLTLNTPVTLTENATLRTGSIIFNSTINSEAGETNNLTIAASGDIAFNGAVGANGRLGAIAIENANNLTATSTIEASSIQHLNGTGIVELDGNITGNGVNLVTRGNVRTSNITSNGGEIRLTSQNGSVTTGTLDVTSQGSGGAIALTSPFGAVTTSDLNATGVASGGNIAVISGDRINTGNINVSATIGNGGSVTLDPPNDIQVGSINAQGGNSGIGGNVDITTARFFRATNSFTDRNNLTSSISTAGGAGRGAIAIRHGGGDLLTAFTVGDGAINGTAAALTTGIDTISPIRIFPARYTQGNIQIITSGQLIAQLTDSTIRRENTPTQNTTVNLNIPRVPIDTVLGSMEELFTRQYETYLGKANLTPIKTLGEIQLQLRRLERETGVKTALIYIAFGRSKLRLEALLSCPLESIKPEYLSGHSQPETCRSNDNDPVELLIVTATGEPIRTLISGATRAQVLEVAKQLRLTILDPEMRQTTDYLEPAQQLYEWLVAPVEADLKARGIENLIFIPDAGLRTTPLAALHNGQNFIIEQYSVSLMPSFSLTQPRFVSLRNASVLAMGASKFTDLSALPAVPVELSTITPQLWPGRTELNEAFTVENLKLQRAEKPYTIVHLATHAQFERGALSNSYIQFWDRKLYLDQIEQFNWNNPPVELLVLSACRTAIGDEQVELGFGGLAVQAGVNSALASLWYVSDEGTLGLMTEFYEQLKTAPTRAEALRRAQLAMVAAEVRLEGGLLYGLTRGGIPLPPELVKLGNLNFSHPFYWSAFTMIGNPW